MERTGQTVAVQQRSNGGPLPLGARSGQGRESPGVPVCRLGGLARGRGPVGRRRESRRELERIHTGEEGPRTPTMFPPLPLVTCLLEEILAYDPSLSYQT